MTEVSEAVNQEFIESLTSVQQDAIGAWYKEKYREIRDQGIAGLQEEIDNRTGEDLI